MRMRIDVRISLLARPHHTTSATACLVLAFFLVAAGCSSPDDERARPVGVPVAMVGEEPIYARDFVLNYELGFPHLRRGDDPRDAYLQRLIDEKLLAAEGYRRGLDQDSAVQRKLESLREELLVEQIFERHVNDAVTVSEEEIEAVMQKDRVSFKIRYLPAASASRARSLRRRAQDVGFERVVADYAASSPEMSVRPADLESPYINWQDVHPDLLQAIENLQIGQVSQPVPYNGSWLLIEVIDIRRESGSPVTDPDARSRYEQVVFQRKARERARAFIGSMMKPLDVRVKAQPFTTLRDNLWRWFQDAPPEDNLLRAVREVDAAYGDSVRSILDDVLITTKESSWTVRDFLREYPIDRYPLRHDRTANFESDLYDAVGLTLRDSAFVARAQSERLDTSSALQHELALWSDKWVYRALLSEASESGESVDSLLARLRAEVRVDIRREVLDTLALSDPGSPGMTLLKGHTMRPAYPVVDPYR